MASETPEVHSKVLEGIRALRAGRIGAALEAWDAAASLDPGCAEAVAFRDYVKQNRIRMAVHIGRLPPAEGAPLELPRSWPPAPARLCDPPPGSSVLSPTGASPEGASPLGDQGADEQSEAYDQLQIAPLGTDTGDAPEVQPTESGEISVLEILLDDEPAETSRASSASSDARVTPASDREETPERRPRSARPPGARKEAPDSAFAEDAPTLTRDPGSPSGHAGSSLATDSPPSPRPGSGSRLPASETPLGLSQNVSPRGTLVGVGVNNPFAGGLKASFGPGSMTGAPGSGGPGHLGPLSRSGPASPAPGLAPDEGRVSSPLRRTNAEDLLDYGTSEGSFSDDLPTRVRPGSPPASLDEPNGAPPLDTASYAPGEDSFADDLPTRALSAEPSASGASRHGTASHMRPMPQAPKAPAEEGFTEDQITIARAGQTARASQPSAEEETDSLDDPRRGLSMARLLHDEGAFERCLQLLGQLQDRHGELPGAAELVAQCQEALESLMADQIGPLNALARPRAFSQKLSDLDLDPRAAYLFSRIDGTLSIEDLLDISGMSRFETLRNLLRLRELGLVDFEPGR